MLTHVTWSTYGGGCAGSRTGDADGARDAAPDGAPEPDAASDTLDSAPDSDTLDAAADVGALDVESAPQPVSAKTSATINESTAAARVVRNVLTASTVVGGVGFEA